MAGSAQPTISARKAVTVVNPARCAAFQWPSQAVHEAENFVHEVRKQDRVYS
jgi:hypothetical protein